MKHAAFLIALLAGPALCRADEPLQAGFGEADITPAVGGDKPVYLAGFGHDRKATGVHDRLAARAVVLKHGRTKVALACVDLVGFFLPNVEHVRAGLSGFDYVLVSSTHSHEGPDSLGLWGPTALQSGVDADYLRTVEKRIIEAVRAADDAARPVAVRIGSVRAPELLHDSREPYVLQEELVVLEFRTLKDDKPAGLVVQWNCHPETLGAANTEISADFVGYTVNALQDGHHCPVVYLSGAVGGLMSSLGVPVMDADGKVLKDGTLEKTARYGALLAEAADRALRDAKPARLTPLETRRRPVFLPMQNKIYLLARQIGVFEREAYVWSGDPYKADLAEPKEAEKPLAVRTEVGYLRLGELEVAVIPGEIYPELVLDKVQDPPDAGADFPDAPVEPAIYKQLKGPRHMIVGLANDEIGYIIPKRQWDEKPPYCYGRKRPQYGEVNSLGPDTAPLLCQAFKELVEAKKD